jgi:hypothetical protein
MSVKLLSAENLFREKIIELLQKHSDATNPSIRELSEQSAGRKFTVEEAAKYFYRDNTGKVLVEEEDSELKGFFLISENDEYFREKIPEY